jgi:hypothetical protein
MNADSLKGYRRNVRMELNVLAVHCVLLTLVVRNGQEDSALSFLELYRRLCSRVSVNMAMCSAVHINDLLIAPSSIPPLSPLLPPLST